MTEQTQVLLGRILPMNESGEFAEAVAWSEGEILAVGAEPEVLEAAGPEAEVERVDGLVMPGFVDAHHHYSITALHRQAVDCRDVGDLETLAERLSRAAESVPAGRWIYAVGYDELNFDTRQHPPLELLDDALPDHPLCLVHYSCHHAVTNSAGLTRAGIDGQTTDPPAGRIERDGSGRPTGLLRETAIGLVEVPARRDVLSRSGDRFLDRLESYGRELLSLGITCVADAAVPPDFESLYRLADQQGKLPVRVVVMPVGDSSYLDPPVERLDGPPTGEGGDRLTVGPVKLLFDGAPECAMCLSIWQATAMSLKMIGRAVRDGSLESMRVMGSMGGRMEGGKLRTGQLFHPRERAEGLVEVATGHGFDVAIHAIGNEAVGEAVDVLAEADVEHTRRIEHASVVDEEDVQRIVDAGIDVVTQPGFLSMEAYEYMTPIPGVRLLPVQSFLEAGGRVALSSDTPVIEPDPMIGVRRAVSRAVGGGRQLYPEEAVDLETALALYTREPARILGMPGGRLAAGQPADIAVLSPDPFDDLSSARVVRTILGGERVYG